MRKSKWASAMEILVTAVGGRWDGADVLMKNLTPGVRVKLRDDVYQCVWRNGQPRLEPVT